jgi:hypothetical protein
MVWFEVAAAGIWRRWMLVTMKMTTYFRDVVHRKHPGIEAAWILRVMAEPLEERQQPDGRYALWGLVPNVHNAFFDRGYLKAIFRSQPPPPQALPPSR